MTRRLLALALLVVAGACGAAVRSIEREPATDHPATAPPGATPVLSARRVPALLAAPVADRRLVEVVEPVLARQRGTACFTVSSDGRRIHAVNAAAPFTPASIQKLITATAALDVLGPDFRFRTTVVAAAPPGPDGVVAGDLHLVGGGDPLLATAAYAARFRNQPQVVTPIESLADAVVAAGVTRIDGRLLGDDRRYDADRYPDVWPARYADQDQSGPLSALSVNDGWVAFPPNPDVRTPDETPAADPPASAAAVLAGLLAARGVTVAGGSGSGPAPEGAAEVAAVESPPLAEVVGEMLRESDNQTAELLVKELAVASGRPGTTGDGIAVVAEHAGAELVVDGSGLAAEDQLTCDQVQAVLDAGAGPIVDGLPVAGRSGTLALRFLDSPLAGRLRAKTGTLNQVTALAGVLTTAAGVNLDFTFMVNLPSNLVVGIEDLQLQEDLAEVLDSYPQGPPLDALGPPS